MGSHKRKIRKQIQILITKIVSILQDKYKVCVL